MGRLRLLRCVVLGLAVSVLGWSAMQPPPTQAQSGVLIPSTLKNTPDASMLSLQVMNVDIRIDNQHAWVRVLQVFDSHVAQVLEGKYLFALPRTASISDFAVWDGYTRIPGVVMEIRRANQIYTQIKNQRVDPGILQQDDEHGGTSAFSAKVFPIPSYGTKRVEMEYSEMLPVDGLMSHFTFPLKPSFGDPQTCAEFNLNLHIVSETPLSAPVFASQTYPLQTVKAGPQEYEFTCHARNVTFTSDFSFDYRLNVPNSTISWVAYRAPETISAYDLRDPALAARNPDGYFQASAIFNQQGPQTTEPGKSFKSRNLVFLFDTSLSMHGLKLNRAVEALDYFLHNLTEGDRFNLILFNSGLSTLAAEPLPGTAENVEKALRMLRESYLSGGTDLRKALQTAKEMTATYPPGERCIVLVSDVNPTLGTISFNSIAGLFEPAKTQEKSNLRLFAFAVGSDADTRLLEELTTRTHGSFFQARETDDISSQLRIFFEKVGTESIENLQFSSPSKNAFRHVYATGGHTFDGAGFSFVGRYTKPTLETTVKIEGRLGNHPIELGKTVSLPEFDDRHDQLPRLWARARVDALLHEIDVNGESEALISEIIRLAQKYKFDTPYTAFIAAPRSLLRPRLIQPGDPVLRVKTDPSIRSVFAVFPFGETLPLTFLPSQQVWEVRFFAPAWLPDGAYQCRLLLTDKDGNGYQETKSFVVDSHAPQISPTAHPQSAKAGAEIELRVDADRDTLRLAARMYGAPAVPLLWSDAAKTNLGKLRIPAGIAPGRYPITVTAEDFAHNQSSAEIIVEVH